MTENNDDNTHIHVVLTKDTMVHHYRIIEKIGAGGMGDVYLAQDSKLDRQVALKFLPSHLSSDSDCRMRFIREAQAVAKLNHPNVVTIFEVSEFENRPFFAMELVEGKSLNELISEKTISFEKIIELVSQICNGLSSAHKKKVIHRDIKPANIVIDSYGNPKILDFGLAAIQDADQLTKTGATLGTFRYMSPEQVEGKIIDQRSDLFSLGIVMYEIFTGSTPFERANIAATLKAISFDNPEPMARIKSGVPESFQNIVGKLLEKTPELRYQSAAEVIRDLKQIDITGKVHSSREISIDHERKMIVVLPFENLGPTDDEYFADGITEEIISRLAVVKKLGVISRTSAMQYKATKKTVSEIGRELNVGYILEGTVRWSKGKNLDRVRITPRLIKVSDDTHLWADRYDRTLEDIFEVQSDISEKVFDQLNIQLLGAELEMIHAKHTDNLDAYQLYLQGLEFAGRPDYAMKDFKQAEVMFTKAVALDPHFALAIADLSRTHSLMYFHGYDRNISRIEKAKSTADKACELQPKLAEVYLALGFYHYYCKLDYALAFKELDKVNQLLPNDSKALILTAAILKRQGKVTESIECYKRAFEISPRDASLPHEIGCAYMTMREYSKAIRYYDLSISLSKNQVYVYVCKAKNCYLWNGNIVEGKKTMTSTPDSMEQDLFELYKTHLISRNYEQALMTLASAPRFQDISQWSFLTKAQLEGYAYHLLSKPDKAKKCYESALKILEAEIIKRPHDDRVRASLGIVNAGLGNTEVAIQEANLAVELIPMSKNAFIAPFRIVDLAFTYTLLGRQDAAIDQLEYVLSIPSWLSVPMLKIDPHWDLLRDNPRFQTLIDENETKV